MEMKLTKSERHTAYIIMLAEAEERDSFICAYGFCRMLSSLFRFTELGGVGYCEQTELLDELHAKQPARLGYLGEWFPHNNSGWQKRIELLKQCIEETYEW